uniref:Ig-like domain-containing protein n=1 Tax=Astyanax mexicanus TaxID=7994 RepID=A0A8B9HU17_ASTMX
MLLLLLLLLLLYLKVQHPLSTVTVAPGGNATLGCSFSASLNINSLIVNWQYGDTVVHSFYLGKDQLERQGANYRGRTHLFKEELLKGNASLLLTAVRSEDVGDYTCHITNEQGSTSEKIKVIMAAPFDEPLLSLQPTCDSINITVTVSNGYPEPEFKWHDSSGRELNQTQSSVLLDSRGRYQVSSTINFQSNSIETISVEIKLEVTFGLFIYLFKEDTGERGSLILVNTSKTNIKTYKMRPDILFFFIVRLLSCGFD